MNRQFAAIAVALSVFALVLPTRSQTFTHVALDGRTVRMLIAGGGDATVVFENGLGPPLEIWGKVQPGVSRFAKTVSYDRAGVGVSDEGPMPRDGRRIAAELHRALRLGDVSPPYILVGFSLGGPFIRVFAGLYPDEVAGMVLVDPTHDADIVEGTGLPEMDAVPDTIAQAQASAIPPGIPVFLIDARGVPEVPFLTGAMRQLRANGRRQRPADSRAYKAWVDGIPGARLVVTDYSGHNVPMEQPALVVDTIRQVAEQIEHVRKR